MGSIASAPGRETGSAAVLVATPDELVALIEGDARFHDYIVKSRGPAFVEVGLAVGSLVFAWPELWQDASAAAPHLARARSGYSPMILLGDDRDFAAHSADALREQ